MANKILQGVLIIINKYKNFEDASNFRLYKMRSSNQTSQLSVKVQVENGMDIYKV